MTTKEKIMLEAEEQFIKYGIANTQMKDIASAVKINRRTLYRYFPTKDELAFVVEMNVMMQISEYLSNGIVDLPDKYSGYEKVVHYFNNVKLDYIKKQIKFTAEFDRYFVDEYPSEKLESDFVESLDPKNDKLYSFIAQGQEDKSIRTDITTIEIYQFLSQSFISLFQRLLLRENHLKYEFCDEVDFSKLYKDIILQGIKNLDH